MSNEEKSKSRKIFNRVVIGIQIIFIIVIILINFLLGKEKFQITYELVILIILMVILALSETFDSFQVGKLLRIEKENDAICDDYKKFVKK